MPAPVFSEDVPQSWLVVRETEAGKVFYEAGWRHRDDDGALVTLKRRLGPAWLERDADGELRPRRGRVRSGHLDEPRAIVAKDRLIRQVEEELRLQADEAWRAANMPPTFRELAAAYMDWLENVRDAKPSTLREHRLLLQEPGLPHKRGRGVTKGQIMKAFGNRPADEVTTKDVNSLLLGVARTGVAPRTVNKTRQLICAIYNYGCREGTFNLPKNPATEADRRPEPERARLEFFSVEEVEALARSLEEGRHRDPRRPAVTEDERLVREAEDRQDGELVRVAAYSGLRRGELVTLKWKDVDFARHKIVVSRTMSADVESTTTKSRKVRDVPLPDQAAGALDRLSQRGDFTGPEDYVFVNRLGHRLDGSAVRRRVDRARDAVGLRSLRFHDLRHTYGSLLVAGGVDLASVKAAMGHSRIATTERYLHARSASAMAAHFTQALAPSAPSATNSVPT